MPTRGMRMLLRPEPPSVLLGLAVASLPVAAITGLSFGLREVSPAESNGVAYLSAAAFNYFALLEGRTLWSINFRLLLRPTRASQRARP